MPLTFKATGCCGIQELTGLSTHTRPEEAMAVFCAQVLGKIRAVAYADRVSGNFNSGPNHMYSFYLFTAAVYESGTGPQRPYGQNFADFIKAHRLGQVSTLPARPNFAFHPDHKIQAWLWKPSLRGLRAWYQRTLDTDTVPTPKPKPTAPPQIVDQQPGINVLAQELVAAAGAGDAVWPLG